MNRGIFANPMTSVREELVAEVDGVLMADSLTVADKFTKRHSDVLRAIRNLDCSDEFRERNFALCEENQQHSTGANKVTYYLMTRDGFIFLAMGFTGKKAATWKEAYISAFNRMEAMLRQMRQPIDFRDPKVIIGVITAQQEQIAEMKPGYEAAKQFMDLGTDAQNFQCVGVRDFAKELGANQNQFVEWLLEKGFCYRRKRLDGKTGELRPRARYDEKEGSLGWFRLLDNVRSYAPHMKITPKGRVELAKRWKEATTPLLAFSNQ